MKKNLKSLIVFGVYTVLITSVHANVIQKVELKCIYQKANGIRETLRLKGDSGSLSGKDGTNPFDCELSMKQTQKDQFKFYCESYQGAPYLRFQIPKQAFNNMISSFSLIAYYLDENTTMPNGEYGALAKIRFNCAVQKKEVFL